MNVWIVNPFDNLPQEGTRPQRYWLMARAFARAGHRVMLWTSDFSHATKSKRVLVRSDCPAVREEDGVEVRMIPTLPYPTNICWARIRSHRKLARDFEAQAMALRNVRPSVIIASTPPLGLCAAAMRVARACGAKFVCDIQDAWPETFERVLPRFVWSLTGMRKTARRLYCEADAVSAVADRYLNLAKSRGSGVPMREFGHAIARGDFATRGPERVVASSSDRAKLRLVYAGNMSLSYDLETVIEAVGDMPDVTLDMAGNGPKAELLKAKVEGLKVGDRVRFHGYLGERELAGLLRCCDVGIVPMFPESCVGVPGKLADYAAAGLRVIESLGGECREIVARYGAGTHYAAGDVMSFRIALESVRSSVGIRDVSAWQRAFDADRIMGEYVNWCADLLG